MKTKTSKLFAEIFRKYLAPIPKMKVSDWADRYRIISAGNAFAGKWRTHRALYQKAIMDAFSEKGVQRIVVMSASQIGKSDIMNNVIGRFAHLDPCPIMMIQPTKDDAEDYSKSRIAPMIDDTKVLKRIFKDSKSRDTGNTILSKLFPGGRLLMVGSNSPSKLASRFIRILLCDEVDRFEASAGAEGDPISLAEKRTTTFWNRLVALFSTPTIKNFSRIESEYLMGTQEEWQHCCPNCKEYHLITHRNLEYEKEEFIQKLDDDVDRRTVLIRSIQWQCPDCGKAFEEDEVKAQPQKYVIKNPEAASNGRRSFFVNGFAPFWISWATILQEYEEAQGDDELLKVVYNTRFAESFEPKGAVENVQGFVEGREEYGAELPEEVLLLTAAVDTQDNRLEYEICGWGVDEECWGIQKGVIFGVPDQKETWNQLDEILDRVYRFADGTGLKVARTFIDSGGHYTKDVYEYCFRNYRKNRIAIKGSNQYSAPLLDRIAKPKGYKIPLFMLGVSQGKQYVFDRLLRPKHMRAGVFHFPKDLRCGYDKNYFKGLVSERLEKMKVGGRWVMVWKNIAPDGRNEPLDLRVYNLACIQSIHRSWQERKIGSVRKRRKKRNHRKNGR